MTENSRVAIEGTLHSVDGKGLVRLKGRYETDIDDLWGGAHRSTALVPLVCEGRGRPPHRRRVHGHRPWQRMGRPRPDRRVWQARAEDLGGHLAGQDCADRPSDSWPRWDELAPSCREKTVVPLEVPTR